MALPRRSLGASGIEVSAFALGSWQTYERIPRADGVAVLSAARECGIDLLEVARYNDSTGRAPIATGYSEVVFGEVFRASGWPRDEVTIANKLWWEFWPEQTAREELTASLQRTGLDHFDFVYCDPPPDELALEEVVGAVGELIADGTVGAWAIVNWPGERVAAAARIARDTGVAAPCAAQLPYSLVARDWVEGPAMTEALALCSACVVASFVLAGGALSGKYSQPGADGRLSGQLESPRAQAALAVVEPLRVLAAEVDATPATLAIAFALANPRVATILFGATSPSQVRENVRAAQLVDRLSADQLAALRALGG
jgi:aryl-alcohol dehydrogenase-like predicted oxidoreductase